MCPDIIKIKNADLRNKMASFDYDWTIVNPKDGKTFPSSIDDWMWLYPNIPEKIKEYYNNGFMIVIFTNQSKKWKYDQIKLVLNKLEIPLFIVIAFNKNEYKPNPILFNCLENKDKIIKEESFFIGDALGRKNDYSDSDKKFAENIGIKYFSPEEFFDFKGSNFEIPNIKLSKKPEIIIMVGYPGSGKTTIAKEICKDNNYIHIPSDLYKTTNKMKKVSIEFITHSKSIVFDATHSSIKKRNELVEHAKKYNYEIRCIHLTTSFDISYKRNNLRNDKKQIPKVAYSVYKKNYEKPTEEEGFKLISI